VSAKSPRTTSLPTPSPTTKPEPLPVNQTISPTAASPSPKELFVRIARTA